MITRQDLEPGAKLAQSCHVAFAFSQDHPDITKQWMQESNYIVVLEVENEQKLISLLKAVQQAGIAVSQFIEPDFDNALTAIAVSPSAITKKMCKGLKLAFS